MRYLRVTLLCVILQGCVLTSLLKESPSLSVEATLGNKEEAVVGQVGNKQEVTVESLSGGLTTNNIQQMPIEFLLIMILGWLMPSPNEIVRGFGDFIKTLRGNKDA